MEAPNPYSPNTFQPDEKQATSVAPPSSTWLRNAQALATVTLIYSVLAAAFGSIRGGPPDAPIAPLLLIASVASAWANVPLGSRIGWEHGGLPVVLVTAVVHVVSAERWTFYTPYSTTIDDRYFVIASPFRSLVSLAFALCGVFLLAAALLSWRSGRQRG